MSETALAKNEPDVQVMQRTGTFQDVSNKLAEAAPLPIRKDAKQVLMLRDWVLVRPCERETTSETGLIFIPESGKERPMEGIVVAHGRGRFDLLGRFWPCEVEIGDRVMYGRYAGNEVVMNGEKCLRMKEEEIDGIIR